MVGWQTDKRIFTTHKIKQGLWLVLCEIAFSMSIHSSQCTFHRFIEDIFRKRNVRCCELLWTSRAHRTYRGRVFSQQFLTRHMRTEQKREKQVSNRTDSSISVDEGQIKESRGRGPFLFPTYLGRSKGLCSQGTYRNVNSLKFVLVLATVKHLCNCTSII